MRDRGGARPSAAMFTLRRMLVLANLVCSDGECGERYEAVAHVADVESLGCECGFGLQVLGWPQPLDGDRRARLALVALDR